MGRGGQPPTFPKNSDCRVFNVDYIEKSPHPGCILNPVRFISLIPAGSKGTGKVGR